MPQASPSAIYHLNLKTMANSTVSCSAGLGAFGNESVSHRAQALDLGLHEVAGLEGRVAVLLHLAVDGEADEQVHVVRHEHPRDEKRSHRSEIVVALAAEPIRAE